ncbi:hypothetical protein [Nonomuraea guangzhouensis]|uniref:Alpha/beta hydrolase n=1 Tax=Nonomuraea guangzhouensis TaxID=1291555 RepID=A0ABW4G855_9ACTN|nr:hypothetical protein [Nonomuraea guangzhouensis]
MPIDWDTPGGATVDLALARRKAADPAARVGSLVDFVVHGSSFFSAELRGRFDIVGFDPRGVGPSKRVGRMVAGGFLRPPWGRKGHRLADPRTPLRTSSPDGDMATGSVRHRRPAGSLRCGAGTRRSGLPDGDRVGIDVEAGR